MRIPPPNYTQIPNVIFDNWMAILRPSSFVVLMCLCRKIFGWHKTSDTISKNQIMKVTGMSKNSVQSAIEELESHGLIIKIQSKNEYGHQPNTYSLNILKSIDEIYSDPYSDQNFGVGRSKSDPGVGQNLTQGVGQNLTPQKKDSTKERITKEREREGESAREHAPPTPPKKLKNFTVHGEMQKVKLTEEELEKLNAKLGIQKTQEFIRRLDLYLAQKGDKYKSHYATILKWYHDDKQEEGTFKLAKHREGSKLAFEKEKDTWRPDAIIVGGKK